MQPDRPDELLRIQAAGGRVIYWDVPRVLGVLAMSRAIGKQQHISPHRITFDFRRLIEIHLIVFKMTT